MVSCWLTTLPQSETTTASFARSQLRLLYHKKPALIKQGQKANDSQGTKARQGPAGTTVLAVEHTAVPILFNYRSRCLQLHVGQLKKKFIYIWHLF